MNEDKIRIEEKHASETDIERGGKSFGSCAALHTVALVMRPVLVFVGINEQLGGCQHHLPHIR